MDRHWVVNCSPIIALAKLGRAHLLTDLSREIVIPSGVAEEILIGGEDDAAREWLDSADAVVIEKNVVPLPLITNWDLGKGESEVLSYAYGHSVFEAIMDDRAARNCARLLSVPVRGTLGILLLAKKEGRLDSLTKELGRLQDVGLYLDDRLIHYAIELAGE